MINGICKTFIFYFFLADRYLYYSHYLSFAGTSSFISKEFADTHHTHLLRKFRNYFSNSNSSFDSFLSENRIFIFPFYDSLIALLIMLFLIKECLPLRFLILQDSLLKILDAFLNQLKQSNFIKFSESLGIVTKLIFNTFE